MWRFDRAKKTPSTRTFHSDAYLTKSWSPSTLVSEVVFPLKTHSGLDSWTDLPILESLVLSRQSAVFSLRLSAVRQTQDGGRTRLRRRRCMRKFLDAPARGQHFPSRGDGGREDFCHYGFGDVYLCICRRTRSQLSHYGVPAVAEARAQACPPPLRLSGRGSIQCSAIPDPGTPFFLAKLAVPFSSQRRTLLVPRELAGPVSGLPLLPGFSRLHQLHPQVLVPGRNARRCGGRISLRVPCWLLLSSRVQSHFIARSSCSSRFTLFRDFAFRAPGVDSLEGLCTWTRVCRSTSCISGTSCSVASGTSSSLTPELWVGSLTV